VPLELQTPDVGDLLLVVTPEEARLGEPYRSAVASVVGQTVGLWQAPACLGEGSLEHPDVERHLEAVRTAVDGRRVVTAHGGVESVLRAAGVKVIPLWELVGREAPRRCGDGDAPLACCGGRAPFAQQHPGDAGRMASYWALRNGPVTNLDARCAAHLRAAELEGVRSVAEQWLAEVTDGP
jgi:hypothetical protein